MPLHQPNKSAGTMYACACRWSVTGILLSLNGGVMKPIRNWLASFRNGTLEELVDAEGIVEGDEDGRREASKRVAKFLMFTSRGRSLED